MLRSIFQWSLIPSKGIPMLYANPVHSASSHMSTRVIYAIPIFPYVTVSIAKLSQHSQLLPSQWLPNPTSTNKPNV
jgi:hypothetical protein